MQSKRIAKVCPACGYCYHINEPHKCREVDATNKAKLGDGGYKKMPRTYWDGASDDDA